MSSKIEIAARTLTALYDAAATQAEREAIKPAAIAANDAAKLEAIGDFTGATTKFRELTAKLNKAIDKVNAPGSREKLQEILNRLGR